MWNLTLNLNHSLTRLLCPPPQPRPPSGGFDSGPSPHSVRGRHLIANPSRLLEILQEPPSPTNKYPAPLISALMHPQRLHFIPTESPQLPLTLGPPHMLFLLPRTLFPPPSHLLWPMPPHPPDGSFPDDSAKMRQRERERGCLWRNCESSLTH